MKKTVLIAALMAAAALAFAQEPAPSPDTQKPVVTGAPLADPGTPETPETPEIPQSILNNRYYLESVRLTEQARTAFETGDYDASAAYSARAAEQAGLSDAYVSMRLADNTIARAHSRYTWAGSVGAARRYPAEYRTAGDAYNEALDARKAEQWEDAAAAANRVIAALAGVTGPGGQAGPAAGSEPPRPAGGTLPAQYTVRLWSATGDCFSAIAGWSWVYGDPYQWRKLYDANRNKLPDPDNPHLIKPGMVLDIPSIKGEVRSGMWDPAVKY
ncbi:MAG: LysM peptidoglycan-binding domain-containing protein [Treponema sp.]|jgi:nucleoid-associated protein YgaU|nr:LysM peptidoglycan-binding domain-containing protein [Treponema sp.]